MKYDDVVRQTLFELGWLPFVFPEFEEAPRPRMRVIVMSVAHAPDHVKAEFQYEIEHDRPFRYRVGLVGGPRLYSATRIHPPYRVIESTPISWTLSPDFDPTFRIRVVDDQREHVLQHKPMPLAEGGAQWVWSDNYWSTRGGTP